MSAYLLVRLKIHDRERFRIYAAAAREIAPRYGARYLAAARPVHVLEHAEAVQPIVLTEWPSIESIHAFWNSGEYQEAIKLRLGAADVTAMIFEAFPDGSVV